jgi:antitoxin ParD1/3/4
MATIKLEIPASLKAWVDNQAAESGHPDASDYVRNLLLREQERQQKIAAMDARVAEALERGTGTRTMDDLAAEARRRAGIARS